MSPILFTVGPLTIYSWGTFLVLGVAVGTVVTIFEGRRRGLRAPELLNLAFLTSLAGLAGARLLYVLVEWPAFRPDPVSAFLFTEGGLSIYGAVLGGAALVLCFARRRGRPFLVYADLMAPGLALGTAIGRIGCFLRGCCYGRLTDQSWGFLSALAGGYRYPSQLMEASLDLALFGLLMTPFLRGTADMPAAGPPLPGAGPFSSATGGRPRIGLRFLTYLTLYSAIRFAVEFYRDTPRVLGPLTLTQLLALLIVVLGAGFSLRLWSRGERAARRGAALRPRRAGRGAIGAGRTR